MQELGKRERLRNGEAVELKPGIFGRLNKENRTLELDSGKTLPISSTDQRDLFPSTESDLDTARRAEGLEHEVKNAPFGEFLYQFGESGIAGGAKDWYNYFTKSGDDYLKQKEAQRRVSSRISEESPFTSGAATVASFAPDIALTGGMSAAKAAPLLTGLSAGSRVVSEPENVATEALFAAGGGKILDMGASALSKIASRRAQSRALPAQQESVRNSNILGQENFNMLKQNVRNTNESLLAQHQKDLATRQNNMLQAQNAFEQAKAAREADVIRLKNDYEVAKATRSAETSRLEGEYRSAKAAAEQESKRLQDEFKVAQKQYQESLNQMPELQRKAQAEFSENVVRNAEQIERSFPKNSKISSDGFELASFLDEGISKTGIAGTKEANQAKRILSSLFPEGEVIGGRELSKRYRALEEAIQRASPDVQTVLNQFKNHLGERLPVILENSIAYSKITPLIKRSVEKDVKSVLNDLNLSQNVKNSADRMAQINLKSLFPENLAPANFIEQIQSGELSTNLAKQLLAVEDFIGHMNPNDVKLLKHQGLLEYALNDAKKQYEFFISEMGKKIQDKLNRYEIKALSSAKQSSAQAGKDIQKTFGLAEPVAPPLPPQAPGEFNFSTPPPAPLPPVAPLQLPAPVAPPQAPSLVAKPSLLPEPAPFNPQPLPTLPAASGMAERTGDFLEKNLLGGKGIVDNPLTKLAGLKYLLGGAALPAEAAYVGMNALTSPTALGEAARMTFKQGGIQAIDSWAQKYPSYRGGILESPQDRRSLTKEIEDSPDIPVEQKAVIQSKINRGKPIQARL